jgi:hypothetical protein
MRSGGTTEIENGEKSFLQMRTFWQQGFPIVQIGAIEPCAKRCRPRIGVAQDARRTKIASCWGGRHCKTRAIAKKADATQPCQTFSHQFFCQVAQGFPGSLPDFSVVRVAVDLQGYICDCSAKG